MGLGSCCCGFSSGVLFGDSVTGLIGSVLVSVVCIIPQVLAVAKVCLAWRCCSEATQQRTSWKANMADSREEDSLRGRKACGAGLTQRCPGRTVYMRLILGKVSRNASLCRQTTSLCHPYAQESLFWLGVQHESVMLGDALGAGSLSPRQLGRDLHRHPESAAG